MTEPLPADPVSAVGSTSLELLTAVVNGEWWKAAVIAVALLSLLIRWKGAVVWPTLGTVPGLVISSFALSFLGGVANAGLAAIGGTVEILPVIFAALKIAIVSSIASGGPTLLWNWFQAKDAAKEGGA